MLPDIPPIRDSLAALSLEETQQRSLGPDDVLVCDIVPRREVDGSLQTNQSIIVLRQSENAAIKPGTLLQRVADALHHAGHAHQAPKTPQRDSLASKIIAAAIILRKSLGGETLALLNQVLSATADMRVTQWAVLPSPAQEFSKYKFDDFEYGVLDTDLLRQRSDRAGSNFAELYSGQLRGRLALCRDSRPIRVVNLNSLEGTSTSRQDYAMMYRIIDEYFASLSEAEQRHFLLELDRQQAIYGAVGLGTISSDVFQRSAAYTMWITVFSAQQRRRGWVSPSQAYPTLATTDPRALAEGRDEIRVGLKLLDWGTRGLDDILQAYSEYLYTARNYESYGRIEEALLHSVFALDLLLGGEAGDSLTAVLADRVAMLSHVALDQHYQEVVRFVRDTYDMRSGYVHRGQRGKLSESTKETLKDRLCRLKTVTHAVLAVACFARSQSWCVGRDARKVWLGRIDILRKKYEIGQGLDPKDVEELGLSRVVIGQGKVASVSIRWPE